MSQKYPDPIQGYDFILGRGGKPTYRLNRKMTAAENVPEEVKAQLLEQYEILSAQRAEENARAEAEEAAKAADELVNQPAAADFVDETSEVDMDTLDQVEIAPPAQVQGTPPAPNPFYQPSPLEGVSSIADTFPTPAPVAGGMSAEEQAILDAYPTDPRASVDEIISHAANTPEYHKGYAERAETDNVEIAAMQQELDRRKDIIENLLKLSVTEATLEELAVQLSERFNIYTVFIGREPNETDLHPITAEVMNNFDRGLAYKQYVRATLSGTLGQVDHAIAVAKENPRYERPVPAQVQQLPPQYQTMEQHEQSHLNPTIKNAESYGIDGIIQDPPINNRRPIVDTTWLNKAKTIDQFDLEEL